MKYSTQAEAIRFSPYNAEAVREVHFRHTYYYAFSAGGVDATRFSFYLEIGGDSQLAKRL
jgi:hypothetical protein